MTFNKTTAQKIDDLCAEYGLPKSIIRPGTDDPCSFYIAGYYYLTMVAESELSDFVHWLLNDKLYVKYGGTHSFLVGAPIELLDKCANPEAWEQTILDSYRVSAEKASGRTSYGYPNMLASMCVAANVIEDGDLDRYFNSDGSWVDGHARDDLVEVYTETMTQRALQHPCSWYMENGSSLASRYDLRDLICKRKTLLNRKQAVELAIQWEMEHLGVSTYEDLIAKYFARWDGKVRQVGEFYAFFRYNPELLRTDPETWTNDEILRPGPASSGEKVTESGKPKQYWDDWQMQKHPDMNDDDCTDFVYFTDEYFGTEDYTNYKTKMSEEQFDEVYDAWCKERENTVDVEPSRPHDDPFAGL